mmetsp:Transcript_44002/g.79074  ORF Transcript_44002/g.79074 Transcript_44002/m.79074 type:complete len:367 (+) Transcript_44002:1257-2357(+)
MSHRSHVIHIYKHSAATISITRCRLTVAWYCQSPHLCRCPQVHKTGQSSNQQATGRCSAWCSAHPSAQRYFVLLQQADPTTCVPAHRGARHALPDVLSDIACGVEGLVAAGLGIRDYEGQSKRIVGYGPWLAQRRVLASARGHAAGVGVGVRVALAGGVRLAADVLAERLGVADVLLWVEQRDEPQLVVCLRAEVFGGPIVCLCIRLNNPHGHKGVGHKLGAEHVAWIGIMIPANGTERQLDAARHALLVGRVLDDAVEVLQPLLHFRSPDTQLPDGEQGVVPAEELVPQGQQLYALLDLAILAISQLRVIGGRFHDVQCGRVWQAVHDTHMAPEGLGCLPDDVPATGVPLVKNDVPSVQGVIDRI